MLETKVYDMEFVDPIMATWTLLRQTWKGLDKAVESRLARTGLTPEKTAILWICKLHRGPLNPSEISRLIFREPQTIAGIINRMEKDGLVRRIPKRKGRPHTEIKLTPKGEELCGPNIEVYKSTIQSLLSGLSEEEQEQFNRTLRKLRQRVLDEIHMELQVAPGYAKPIPTDW